MSDGNGISHGNGVSQGPPAFGAPPAFGSTGLANSAGLGARSFGAEKRRAAPEVSQQMDRHAIAQWVLYQSDPERKKFQCVQFTLANKNADDVLTHFLIPKTAPHAERMSLVEQLVQSFADESWSDAQGYPFKQTYKVMAVLTDDAHAPPYNSKTFVVTPPPEAADGFAERAGRGGVTGEIDPKAVIGELQRLLDTRMRLDSDNTQAMIDRFADAEQRSRDREEALHARYEQLLLEREALRDTQAEREARTYTQRIEAHAYSQLVDGALKYGGAIASHLVAAKLGGGPAADLATFAKTLEPEQVLGLLSIMTDAQREAFQPVGMQISQAWPVEKRDRLVKLHADLSAAKLAQAQPAQPEPPQPPPAPAPTPVHADPEWKALGYLSEVEWHEAIDKLRASAPVEAAAPRRPCAAGHASNATCEYCEVTSEHPAPLPTSTDQHQPGEQALEDRGSLQATAPAAPPQASSLESSAPARKAKRPVKKTTAKPPAKGTTKRKS